MFTKLFLFCCCVFLFMTSNSQSDLRRITVSDLPEEIQAINNINIAVRWTDSLGDNILITAKKVLRPSDDVFFRREQRRLPAKELSDNYKESPTYAYHYFIKKDSAIFDWQVTGTPKPCSQNEKGNTVKCSFIITDLNNDKIAEVWLIYKAMCMEDETPSGMKIIMYENGKRYTMDGDRFYKNDDGKITGGNFNYDNAFKTAPAVFLNYAEQLWKKNANE